MRCPLHGTFHVHPGLLSDSYVVVSPDNVAVAASGSWPLALRIAHLLEVHGLIAVDLDQMPSVHAASWPPPAGMPVENPIEPTEAMRRHPSTYEGGDR